MSNLLQQDWNKHIESINPNSVDCCLVDDATLLFIDAENQNLCKENIRLEYELAVLKEANEKLKAFGNDVVRLCLNIHKQQAIQHGLLNADGAKTELLK